MALLRTSVPTGETPAGACEYCGQPFPTDERLTLHKGLEHYQRLDDAERESFESAFADEKDDLHSLRLRALAMLVGLYFGFLLLYAFFA